MVQVSINFSNKAFYTLITVVSLLVISGVVIAYNSNLQPSVFGHTVNEIENFNQSVRNIVNEALGISLCGTAIYTSGAGEVKGYTNLIVPASCITQDNSDPGCTIIQEIFDLSDNVIIRKQTDYSQGGNDLWWSSYSTSGTYKNGDSKYSLISQGYTSNNIAVYDDMVKDSYSEKSSNQWSIRDSSSKYGQRIYICSSN